MKAGDGRRGPDNSVEEDDSTARGSAEAIIAVRDDRKHGWGSPGAIAAVEKCTKSGREGPGFYPARFDGQTGAPLRSAFFAASSGQRDCWLGDFDFLPWLLVTVLQLRVAEFPERPGQIHREGRARGSRER